MSVSTSPRSTLSELNQAMLGTKYVRSLGVVPNKVESCFATILIVKADHSNLENYPDTAQDEHQTFDFWRNLDASLKLRRTVRRNIQT